MFHAHLRRIAAVAIVSVSVLGTVAAAPAGSATLRGITCSDLKGTFVATATDRATITFSGCTGNTGGASAPIYLPTNGVINWQNGTTTTFGEPKLKQIKKKPGAKRSCPAGSVRLRTAGDVTADTTGSVKVPGKFKEDICVNRTTGIVTIAPGSKVTIS